MAYMPQGSNSAVCPRQQGPVPITSAIFRLCYHKINLITFISVNVLAQDCTTSGAEQVLGLFPRFDWLTAVWKLFFSSQSGLRSRDDKAQLVLMRYQKFIMVTPLQMHSCDIRKAKNSFPVISYTSNVTKKLRSCLLSLYLF